MLRTTDGGEKLWQGLERWPAWLGPWLGKLRLHAIEPRQAPGQPPTIAKRRRWFGPLLIGPANLYLRLLESRVRILPKAEWQSRERALHRVLHGIGLETGPRGWLILPRWPGVVLADYARSRIDPAPARLRGLDAASRALRDLHRVELARGDGVCERLSHGDATLRNVLFDPETGEARWYDFDTAHDPGLAPAWRHGDDLRALVYSSVESFADVPVTMLLRTVRDAYADPGPWEQLRDRLARGALHRSPLHFAQACPPDGRRRELESLLLRGDWPCGSLMGGADGRSIGEHAVESWPHRTSAAHPRRPDERAHRLRQDRVTAELASRTHEMDPGGTPMSQQEPPGRSDGSVGPPDTRYRTPSP